MAFKNFTGSSFSVTKARCSLPCVCEIVFIRWAHSFKAAESSDYTTQPFLGDSECYLILPAKTTIGVRDVMWSIC